MEKALGPLREGLRKVKPWAAVATTLAVLLVGYSVLQARTYLTASDDLDAATVRLGQLANVIDQLSEAAPDDVEAAKAQREEVLETRQVVLQEWKDQLVVAGYPSTTDPLLAILFAVASESNVGLRSIALREPEFLHPDEGAVFQYHVQPISLIVDAKSHGEIYRFLSQLHLENPSIRVEAISLTGFGGGDSAAEVILEFHLSPHPPPEEEEGG